MSYLRTDAVALSAGVAKRMGASGRKFLLLESTDRVDMKFIDITGQTVGEAFGVLDGLGITLPRDFFHVEFRSTNAQTIRFAVAAEDVDFTRVSGSVAVSNTVTVAGTVTANVAKSTALTNVNAVTVGTTAVSVKAAAAANKSVVFFSPRTNTAPIYIGATGVTTANGAIELMPGDHWVEDESAASAFFAISTAASQSLRIQTRS